MKRFSLRDADVIPRPYGLMKMLVGSGDVKMERMDLRVLEVRAGESTTTHHHRESESVFYVLSGRVEVLVGGVAVPLGPTEGVIVEPGEVHCLKNLDRDASAVILEAMSPPFSKRDIFYHGGQD